MNRMIPVVALGLFLCTTAGAFQGGGGQSTKKGKSTRKVAPAQSQSAPILTSGTEGSTRGEKIASVPIVNAVLNAAGKDLVVRLHECMSENHIGKNAANKLFVSVHLPSINQNQQIYFVRPALDTPCFSTLIGAHAFNYWLVSLNNATYNVSYHGFSDHVSILRSIHNGMYDIEEESYSSYNALTFRSQFDGSKYVNTICKEKHRTNRGKEVVKIIPCNVEPDGRSSTPTRLIEITTPSGLKYTDLVVGTGAVPQRGQKVSVHYTGTLENGTEFDSSRRKGTPMEYKFGVTPMIPGWDEGVSTMKAGGRRKLVVPARLGYGQAGRSVIPPNATLIFDIELLGVK